MLRIPFPHFTPNAPDKIPLDPAARSRQAGSSDVVGTANTNSEKVIALRTVPPAAPHTQIYSPRSASDCPMRPYGLLTVRFKQFVMGPPPGFAPGTRATPPACELHHVVSP